MIPEALVGGRLACGGRLAVGSWPVGGWTAAESGSGLGSFGTLLGIALYGAIAYFAIRCAVRWAEAALVGPTGMGEPVTPASRRAPDAGRRGS